MKIINTGRAGGMTAVVAVTVAVSTALFVGIIKGVLALSGARRSVRERKN